MPSFPNEYTDFTEIASCQYVQKYSHENKPITMIKSIWNVVFDQNGTDSANHTKDTELKWSNEKKKSRTTLNMS